jgi:hypothetical protein
MAPTGDEEEARGKHDPQVREEPGRKMQKERLA